MARPQTKIRKSDRTRAAILAAARAQFARHGYEATTIRDVAAAAAIDPSMVMRYFGSKDELFARAAAIELHLPDLSKLDRAMIGEALAQHFVSLWEGPQGNPGMTILLRAAATNDDAAQKMREVFAAQVSPTLMKVGRGADFPARAALISTQLLGLAFCRYILKIPPLVAMPNAALTTKIGAILQRLIDGDDA